MYCNIGNIINYITLYYDIINNYIVVYILLDGL